MTFETAPDKVLTYCQVYGSAVFAMVAKSFAMGSMLVCNGALVMVLRMALATGLAYNSAIYLQ